MITTLNDFINEYKKICARDWITTHRAGSTGIGKTLEDLLDIPENNLDQPDFGDYELKSCRIGSNSMLTMFTRAPEPAKSNTALLQKYGYSSSAYSNKEKVLHATLSAHRFTTISDTGNRLKIHCGTDRISIESQNGIENIYWTRASLEKCFNKKYKNKFVYAYAYSRGSGASEQFKYDSAYEVSGFDYKSFIKLLENGKIKIDLRIGQYPDGRTHDHGTAFRINVCDQNLLFIVKNKIV